MSSCVASVLAELCRREPLGLGTGEDRSTTMRNSSSDQTWGMDTQSGASTAAFSSSSNARVIDWVWAEGHTATAGNSVLTNHPISALQHRECRASENA